MTYEAKLLMKEIDELKAENERLQSQNAMLLDAYSKVLNQKASAYLDAETCMVAASYRDLADFERVVPLVELVQRPEALNATSESIQQWLTEHDKEVRNKALAEFTGLNLKENM